MIAAKLFKTRPSVEAARALYAGAVAQARRPDFYLRGAPDTPEGRFELYALHVLLILNRLRGQGGAAAEVSQTLFDAFLRGLDDGLREMGVGDLSVGKKMRKLGEAVYGRAKSYDAALRSLPDRRPLEALIARTVLQGLDSGLAPALAAYVAEAHAFLSAQPTERIVAGKARWPEPVL